MDLFDWLCYNNRSMSDLVKPGQPREEAESETDLPNSRDLGLESSVHEFNNTTLQEAHDQDLLHPLPNTVPSDLSPADEPNRSKLWLKIGVPVAAGAALGAAFFAGRSSGDSDKISTATKTHNVEKSNQTPPATALEAHNYDFRKKENQSSKFTPEYAQSDIAEELLTTVFGNLEKALSQRNQKYLPYYLSDMSSEQAQRWINAVNKADNYYDVTINFQILNEAREGNTWHMTINRIINIQGKIQTAAVSLDLVKKDFIEPDPTDSQNYKIVKAWVVTQESRI